MKIKLQAFRVVGAFFRVANEMRWLLAYFDKPVLVSFSCSKIFFKKAKLTSRLEPPCATSCCSSTLETNSRSWDEPSKCILERQKLLWENVKKLSDALIFKLYAKHACTFYNFILVKELEIWLAMIENDRTSTKIGWCRLLRSETTPIEHYLTVQLQLRSNPNLFPLQLMHTALCSLTMIKFADAKTLRD